ncbi:MAG: site-specific integrase [Pseudomonadota bacterium]
MSSNNNLELSAQIEVLLDVTSDASAAIRRLLLRDKLNGLIYELPMAFVHREYPQKSFNTHRAVLRDISFFIEWMKLKSARQENWKSPQQRTPRGGEPLTKREIEDFSRWAQLTAPCLTTAVQRAQEGVKTIPAGKTVDTKTANARLRTVCRYLCWLIEDCVDINRTLGEADFQRQERHKTSVRDAFERQLNEGHKPPPVKSLTEQEGQALRTVLSDPESHKDSSHGRRDRLITRLLLETGLRAGELLKLCCHDLDPRYPIGKGKFTAVLKVKLRPNDLSDSRISEPAAKTTPGFVTISNNLADAIINYVTTDRRAAVDRCSSKIESPYLFVCHSGTTCGRPMSQRNLNRIVSKLNGVLGLPDDFSPHRLRHTHFTELADIADEKGTDYKQVLAQRGRWSENSNMLQRYSARSLMRKTAELIQARDDRLAKP